MNKLAAIVEGETERAFVNLVLAPHFHARGVYAYPVLGGSHGSGSRRWQAVARDIRAGLRSGSFCTTMFDPYELEDDWPGYAESRQRPFRERAARIEAAAHETISAELGPSFDPSLFVPYIQLYEFEALLFSDIEELSRLGAAGSRKLRDELREQLDGIVAAAGEPEAINDSHETCPSRRISKLIRGYVKASDGPALAQRIGLATIRAKCPHFNSWLTRLESLAPARPTP